MFYFTLKSLHIIFIVSYFLGIFTVGQTFLYYKQSDNFSKIKKNIVRKQYLFMAERLWNIIIIPSGLITFMTGLLMIFLNKGLFIMHWFELKLIFLTVLILYHYWCWEKIRHLKELCGKDLKSTRSSLIKANEMSTVIIFLLGCTVIEKYSDLIYSWKIITGIFALLMFFVTTLRLLNKN